MVSDVVPFTQGDQVIFSGNVDSGIWTVIECAQDPRWNSSWKTVISRDAESPMTVDASLLCRVWL